MATEMLEVLAPPCYEAVEYPYIVAVGDQSLDEVRPDEAATPGDQNALRAPRSLLHRLNIDTTTPFRPKTWVVPNALAKLRVLATVMAMVTRMTSSRWAAALVGAALVAVASAPGIAAAQTGGRADPRSPSGTEYDIPLEEARREAAGGPSGAGRSRTRRPGGTDSAAPRSGGGRSGTAGGGLPAGSTLFGAGISATGSSPGGGERGKNRSDPEGGRQGGGGSSPGGRRPGEQSPLGSIPPLVRAEGSGVGGSWWPALLAAAVLAAGAGFGLLIARLRSRRGGAS